MTRYIVTTHKYVRHATAAEAIAERDRLRAACPQKADKFRVLTIIDEANEAKLKRDATADLYEADANADEKLRRLDGARAAYAAAKGADERARAWRDLDEAMGKAIGAAVALRAALNKARGLNGGGDE